MRITWVAGFLAIGTLAGCIFSEYDEEGRLRYISPAAMAALPPGIDSGFLIRDDDGCYGIALEQGESVSGIPLRADDGTQVCDA